MTDTSTVDELHEELGVWKLAASDRQREIERLRKALRTIAEYRPLFTYVGRRPDIPGSPYDRGRAHEAKHLSDIASAELERGYQ
jgi:hypothetical protein